jgi:hypothetical protein
LDSWTRLQALTEGPYLQADLAPALEEYQDRLLRLGLEALTLAIAAKADRASTPSEEAPSPQTEEPAEEEPAKEEPSPAEPEIPVEEPPEEEPPEEEPPEEGPSPAEEPAQVAEPEPPLVEEEPPLVEEEPPQPVKKLTWEEEELLQKQKMADVDKLINMICDFKAEQALILTRDGWYKELARLLQLDLWELARKETIADLASYLAASIRAVDEVMVMMVPDRQAGAEAMKRVKSMMERVKPVGGQVPPVHGLQLRHVPREGTHTWQDYADYQRAQIQGATFVTLSQPPTKKTVPKKKKKAPDAPSMFEEEESEPDHLQPRLDLIQPLTIGQTWVVLGGDPRPDKEVVWKDMFLLDGISWVPNGGGKKEAPRRVTSICHAMKGGGIQGVIMLQGFVPHASSNRLIEAYKITGVPVFVVSKGYGNAKVLEAVEHRLLGRKPSA